MGGVDKRILARGPDSTNAELSRLAPLIREGGYVPFCNHHVPPTQGLLNLEELFIQRFVHSFAEPPPEITLDVDLFDDPTHGQQQLTFFHGFYDQYQYLVRALTCAENDLLVLPVLLHGTADAALGFVADLERVVTQLRQRFPGVLIRLRADSGFARPLLYDGCERLDVEYSIGLGMNAVLKRKSDELLQTAVNAYETTGEP
jgi:hypothetical protein